MTKGVVAARQVYREYSRFGPGQEAATQVHVDRRSRRAPIVGLRRAKTRYFPYLDLVIPALAREERCACLKLVPFGPAKALIRDAINTLLKTQDNDRISRILRLMGQARRRMTLFSLASFISFLKHYRRRFSRFLA